MSCEVVFGEKGLGALLAYIVPLPFMGIQVFLQAVGPAELLVAFWALYLAVTGRGRMGIKYNS